jgi:hypothetical protein
MDPRDRDPRLVMPSAHRSTTKLKACRHVCSMHAVTHIIRSLELINVGLLVRGMQLIPRCVLAKDLYMGIVSRGSTYVSTCKMHFFSLDEWVANN